MCGRRVLLPTARNGQCRANREQPAVCDKIREERKESCEKRVTYNELTSNQRGAYCDQRLARGEHQDQWWSDPRIRGSHLSGIRLDPTDPKDPTDRINDPVKIGPGFRIRIIKKYISDLGSTDPDQHSNSVGSGSRIRIFHFFPILDHGSHLDLRTGISKQILDPIGSWDPAITGR